MEHEAFPVPGFEFMDEPATEIQKDFIVSLAERAGVPITRNGPWPEPLTKWDAYNMIQCLESRTWTVT
jgi:hypothetical protein